MAVGEDLRLRAGLADERIVRRHAAVVFEPQRLPDVVVERLRFHAQAVVFGAGAAQPVAIADHHVQRAVGTEHHASGEIAARLPRVGDEDLRERPSACRPRASARDGERVALARPCFGYDT